jgi:hypothetical protein
MYTCFEFLDGIAARGARILSLGDPPETGSGDERGSAKWKKEWLEIRK